MTKQEEQYFDALIQDRTENAKVLEKPSMSGTKDSVTDKYSDQAHFIYELLQNADDAGATQARFVLYADRLIFAHNGTVRFTVSNPNTEKEDKAHDKLGHINAITSIGNSTKNEAKIGKFGVGFKAVFQYTATPYIYDPNIFFRITRFIVPERLETDYPERKKGETLFVFPFNSEKISKEEAFADIAEKLQTLSSPVLFLSSLKKISFKTKDVSGEYGKKNLETCVFPSDKGDTKAERLELASKQGKDSAEERLWLFSREDEGGRTYSVGFFLNENGKKLRKCEEPAFCFFPTKERTGLNFIIHAPFLLTDSREGIKAGVQHNKDMIKLLADLAADSLSYLCDIGLKSSVRLIDDHILDIIPANETDNAPKNAISFKPFYTVIKKKLQTDNILPTKNKNEYAVSKHAYCADSREIMNLFTDKHLQYMTRDPEARWVFTTTGANSAYSEYVEDLIQARIGERDIFNGKFRYRGWFQTNELVKGIDAEFIERQPISWLHKFYRWVSESRDRKNLIRKEAVFLSKNGKALPAYDDRGEPILFLPSEEMPLDSTVHPELMKNEDTLEFFKNFGIHEPSKRDYIYNVILPQYKDGKGIDTNSHFKLFFQYYRDECPKAETDRFIELIKGCEFVRYSSEKNKTVYRGRASDLYFPTDDLRKYFSAKPETPFVEWDGYVQLVKDDEKKDLESFLSELGVRRTAVIDQKSLGYGDSAPIPGVYFNYSYGSKNRWRDQNYLYKDFKVPYLDGLPEILKAIKEEKSEEKSFVLWRVLLNLSDSLPKGKTLINIMTGTMERRNRETGGYKYRHGTFDSPDMLALRQEPWLMDKSGQFLAPCKMTLDSLSPLYDREHACAEELVEFLQIKKHIDPPTVPAKPDFTQFLTDEQKNALAFGEMMQQAGIKNPEDIAKFLEWREEQKQKEERQRNRNIDSISDRRLLENTGNDSRINKNINSQNILDDGEVCLVK